MSKNQKILELQTKIEVLIETNKYYICTELDDCIKELEQNENIFLMDANFLLLKKQVYKFAFKYYIELKKEVEAYSALSKLIGINEHFKQHFGICSITMEYCHGLLENNNPADQISLIAQVLQIMKKISHEKILSSIQKHMICNILNMYLSICNNQFRVSSLKL